jgi:DNA-binding NtrC family response regulator
VSGELRPLREARLLFDRAYLERLLQTSPTVAEAARRAGLERSHLYQLGRRIGCPVHAKPKRKARR